MRRDFPLAALDTSVVLVAYLMPLVVRFDGAVPLQYWANFWLFAPVAVLLHLLVNFGFGLYGQMWRYASVQEARRVVLAAATSGALVLVGASWLGGATRYLPLSVVVLGAGLSLMGFGAIRFQSRLFAFRRRVVSEDRKRSLIVGAGDAGAMLVRDVLRNASLGLDPVAIVDDDPKKIGRSLHGVPIVGSREDLPALVQRLRVDQVLLAIPSATSEVVQRVAALCEEADVTLRVLPSVHELVGDRVSARDIRDLRIEDLLGRQQVETDLEAVAALIRGRRVLITGAGGSIGAEISRQVAAFDPSSLLILDHDETHLHDLGLQLGDRTPVQPLLADIRDQDRVLGLFLKYRPEVVFHAAAHKHVPVLEENPEEALRTNVFGTANVAEAAVIAGTRQFVLISTDKAVRPTSVMGASKWFAEQVIRSLDPDGCVFCSVRFGNVLGSRGSVIPTFFQQIARGGPVTVTDREMTRYFMSLQEAVQLVLQAAALSRGGEVFTLDMGEPVSIMDLARKLIHLSGRVPNKDIAITVVGKRPGEKLVEDLVDPEERPAPSSHPSITVSHPVLPDRAALRRALWELEALMVNGSVEELSGKVKALAFQGVWPAVTDPIAVGDG
ncbi:MAG TPA: nucleoside-diphosphate sugar epimerase/dehydratase [Actinomycetota bacterium]|nr:nucleoside-diphosphate sugar epimerase/dehydratase [Actinomycetota bacterium]